MKMPLFSVIIPTYNHADPIIWAIRSVQNQVLQDFEILVMGDGVPDRTRKIMAAITAQDSRVTFFDNEKGAAKGEIYRDLGVRKARGEYIAYLADDDLWAPNHLKNLAKYLNAYDFCNTLHTCIYPDGRVRIFPGDIDKAYCRNALKTQQYNFFGPSCVGHTKVAYEKLPQGWTPAPKGTWTDLHMWRQWFACEGMRFKTIPRVTTVHLDSPGRDEMLAKDRAGESEKWFKTLFNKQKYQTFEKHAFEELALSQGCYKFYSYHWYDEFLKVEKQLKAMKALVKKKR